MHTATIIHPALWEIKFTDSDKFDNKYSTPDLINTLKKIHSYSKLQIPYIKASVSIDAQGDQPHYHLNLAYCYPADRVSGSYK